jgi:hypothetical protein
VVNGGTTDIFDISDDTCRVGFDTDGSSVREIFESGYKLGVKSEDRPVQAVKADGNWHFFIGTEEEVANKLRNARPPEMVEPKEYKAKEVKCLRDTEMVMVTFGNQQVHPIKAGEMMYYDRLFHQNDKFTVVQSGLNHYTMATSDFEWKK